MDKVKYKNKVVLEQVDSRRKRGLYLVNSDVVLKKLPSLCMLLHLNYL